MFENIEYEINSLKLANLYNQIPIYLFNHYKNNLNYKILPNLLTELDNIIKSIDTNNSLEILTLEDEFLRFKKKDSFFNHELCENKQIIEVSSRLSTIFKKYYNEVFNYINFVENKASTLKVDNLSNRNNFLDQQELLTFQRAICVQKLKTNHYNLLTSLFQNVFDIYQNLKKDSLTNDEEQILETKINIDKSNNILLNKSILFENFQQINTSLFHLDLFDHLCGDIVVQVVENKIRKHIEDASLENYEESFIISFEKWLEKIVIGWIKLIYSSSIFHSDSDLEKQKKFEQYLENYQNQLAHYMYTYYGQIRIKRLFDIIIDFPDSKNAIDDLKICLTKTNLRSNLINSLKSSIEQRLLHPGVNTSDILTAYVSAIKALLCVDPSGVMMENVCEPLKKYLRNRDDTVKCIISNLTDDGESSNDLMEEFCKDLYNNDGCLDLIDSNVAMPIQTCQNDRNNIKNNHNKARSWELWIPDAVDAVDSSALDNNRQGSKSNIISMLVNIYGSKDMFVNEYKTLLADRLLSNYSYNMEKEIRNLELLKLRFGDSNLFSCEAMLKDISESKRINTNILEQLKQKGIEKIESFEVGPSSLKCLILSEQFWPKLKEEKIELPNEFKQIQEKFMNSYEAFKGNRTLIWKNNLGQVNIEIEINKQIMEFNVTPIQAAVILKFQEKDRWSIHELSQSLKMCSIALRKKLVYWKMQGLIKEASVAKSNNANEIIDNVSNEIYVLVKENGKLNKSKSTIQEEEDIDKMGHSSEILKDDELKLYWKYVESMLRGCGCLPVDRIHTWLKLYANPEITIEQVKFLIDIKTKEQLLKYNAGLYRLNK